MGQVTGPPGQGWSPCPAVARPETPEENQGGAAGETVWRLGVAKPATSSCVPRCGNPQLCSPGLKPPLWVWGRLASVLSPDEDVLGGKRRSGDIQAAVEGARGAF